MSEENEAAEPVASGLPDTAGLAIDLAMEEARADPSLREDVAVFLRDQRSLIEVQKHHLHEQFKQLSQQLQQLRLAVWEKRLGVVLRIGTAFLGLAFAGCVSFLLWQASQSKGLRIQPLSVPPDLVARGITGEVIAGRLLDQLNHMQAATNSRRASRTYASDWSQQGIKLDVPETGISLAELDRFVRDRLGNDIQVSGDIVATASGLTLTVRAGAVGDASVSGPESALSDLVHQAAEAIYRITQPYRYAVFIRGARPEEAQALFSKMAVSGVPEDRPWAYNGWALNTRVREGVDAALALFEKGSARQPNNPLITTNMSDARLAKGQWEISLALAEKAIPLANNNSRLFRPESVEPMRISYIARRDRLLGDFGQAVIGAVKVIESNDPGQISPLADLAVGQMSNHEWSVAHESLIHPPPQLNPFLEELNDFNAAWAQMQIDSAGENWLAALAGQSTVEMLTQKNPGLRSQFAGTIVPLVALAKAHLGRTGEAERDLAQTAGDCDPCLIARAQLAQLKGQSTRSDFWFKRAVANAPSIPFATETWGRALLERGKPDEAIEKFKLANKKGPHFADPLEGWGEALMAKNQSHLALAKFAEAVKCAPNWGRLHLKWGEALVYAGKKGEAKIQFARAAQLDLTPSEKTELAKPPL